MKSNAMIKTIITRFAASFVLIPALFAQPQSVISGRLVGCDGKPMKKGQVHLIVPWENFDRMILTSADVASDGTYRLTLDRTGLYMVYFTGVDHLNLEFPVMLEKPLTVSISARLRSFSPPAEIKEVGIIGDFNAFSKYASGTMNKQPDGTYWSEFETKAPTFSYQVVGPFGPLGKLMAVNGTQSDDYVFDKKYLTSYRSVIKTAGGGKIRIVFDPKKLSQCPSEAELRFEGNPLVEQFARISMDIEKGIEKIKLAREEEPKPGKGTASIRDNWAKDLDNLKNRMSGEKDPLLRQALLIGYLRLANTAGITLESDLASQVLDEIPPTSPVWDLDPWVFRSAGHVPGQEGKYEAYLEKVLEQNPDPNLKAALLYGELSSVKEPEKARRLLERLVKNYPNSRFTESARRSFSPEKKVQVGGKLPTFSVQSFDDAKVAFSNASLKGKYFLLDFWATWCVACVAEMGNIHQAYAKFKNKGFEILSLSLDLDPKNISRFRRDKWKMPWLHAYVEGGGDSAIAKDFEVDGLPRSILIDPKGTILASGEDLRGSKLERTLSGFLGDDDSRYDELPGYGNKCPFGEDYYFTYRFVQPPKIGTATLKVELFDKTGNRITDLEVTGNSGMPSMRGAHDSGDVPFKLNKKGDYLLPVNIVMPGEWEVKLRFLKDKRVIYLGSFRFHV